MSTAVPFRAPLAGRRDSHAQAGSACGARQVAAPPSARLPTRELVPAGAEPGRFAVVPALSPSTSRRATGTTVCRAATGRGGGPGSPTSHRRPGTLRAVTMELAAPSLAPELFLEGELLDATFTPYSDDVEALTSSLIEVEKLAAETAQLERELEQLSAESFPSAADLSILDSARKREDAKKERARRRTDRRQNSGDAAAASSRAAPARGTAKATPALGRPAAVQVSAAGARPARAAGLGKVKPVRKPGAKARKAAVADAIASARPSAPEGGRGVSRAKMLAAARARRRGAGRPTAISLGEAQLAANKGQASRGRGKTAVAGAAATTTTGHVTGLGAARVLSGDEEKDLARQVQELIKLEETRDALLQSLKRQPNVVEWAEAVGEPAETFRAYLMELYDAKDRMIHFNQRLVVSVARKYMGRGVEHGDLVSEGLAGLLRGVEKFDPSRGYKFSTYAHWWIRQAITRAVSENSRAVRVPVHMYEVYSRVRKARTKFVEEHDRKPNEEELAAASKVTVNKLRKVEAAYAQTKSMDELVTGSEGETIGDSMVDSGENTEQVEEKHLSSGMMKHVESVLDTLDKREADILRMRHGLNPEGKEYTLEEIGRAFQVTRERIRQLETKALRNLRQKSRQTVLTDYLRGSGEAQSRAQGANRVQS